MGISPRLMSIRIIAAYFIIRLVDKKESNSNNTKLNTKVIITISFPMFGLDVAPLQRPHSQRYTIKGQKKSPFRDKRKRLKKQSKYFNVLRLNFR